MKICVWCPLEVPRWGASNDSHYMFLWRIKLKYELFLWKKAPYNLEPLYEESFEDDSYKVSTPIFLET